MEDRKFKAMYVEEIENKQFRRSIRERRLSDLPDNDVLIQVKYSSLNYKDALSARGHRGITRRYPHTPGIDAAGIVAESRNQKFSKGMNVLVTGYDLGMNTSGGFAEYIRVPAEWIVPLPAGMSLRESMIYGTAGFTAGIAINELQNHGVSPESGKIIVTGASGGVGSLAVAMMHRVGYTVEVSTGKVGETDFFYKLGASNILERDEVSDKTGKPLLTGRWIGAIDNLGGNTLSTLIRSVQPRGVIACIGNVISDKFECSVYPFILRGVTLIGIDSAERPMDYRLNIWEKIANEWKLKDTEFMVKEVGLNDLSAEIDIMLHGGQKGKILVNLS